MLGDFWSVMSWFASSFVILLLAAFEALAYLIKVFGPLIGWAIQTLLLYAILLALKKRPWR